MDEFMFFVGIAGTVFVCMAVWFVGGELLTRLFNNDWCYHKWDNWGELVGSNNNEQYRCCKKCNKIEKRTI